MTDAESEADDDRLVVLETAILRGPIVTRADAAAKARLITYAMDVGERGDGLDLALALQLAEWLERSVRL